MSRIQISLADRWVILGATGSGKTTVSKRLLWTYGHAVQGSLPIYILDTKGFGLAKRNKDDFREFYHPKVGRIVRGAAPPRPFVPRDGRPFMVWQPEEDIPDAYDKFMHDIYKSGIPSVVYFDELSSLDPNGTGKKLPRHFGILQKQGRGLDIATISVTQSPAYIDHNLLRQTTHIVRMRLNVDDGETDYDVQKIAKKGGRAMIEEPEDDHGFWYRNVTRPVHRNPPAYYSDLKEFFGDGD